MGPPTQTPKRSPNRSPRQSPKRRALHERSDSDTNALTSPSLRMVDRSDAEIYASDPFPSRPSQILSPSQGFMFEDGEHDVSHFRFPYNAPTKPLSGAPRPLQISKKRGNNLARPGIASEIESPTSNLQTSPSSVEGPSSHARIKSKAPSEHVRSLKRATKALSDTYPIPSGHVTVGSDSGLAHSPSVNDEPPRALAFPDATSNVSYTSLASMASSDVPKGKRSKRRSASYTAFPPPIPIPASKGNASTSSALFTPVPQKSTDSLSSSSASRPSSLGRRSSSIPSVPSVVDLRTAQVAEAKLQYPVVRAPSASGSWAATTITIPKRQQRIAERAVPRSREWSTQLSTVSSGSERTSQANTDERSSGGYGRMAEDRMPSISSSLLVEHAPSEDSTAYPPPLFSPNQRGTTGTTIRMVSDADERNDSITDLHSPMLRPQVSGFLSISSAESRPATRNDRPISKGSFLTHGIPAWARTYYARNGHSRGSLGAPFSSTEATGSRPQSTSPVTDNLPLSIFRPRNRPHDIDMPDRRSMEITPAPQQQGLTRGPSRRKITELWSPHLQQDKRTTARRSMWREPPFEERQESNPLDRRNVQILAFCIGFVCPIAWMIGAFLPLPRNPYIAPKGDAGRPDIEEAMTRVLGPVDEAKYENARWWRNLNRILSVVGLIVIIAVIALAVVAAHM
ncbi:MAG: hypothetical protein M1835_006927 [Candelina submexicana]|nr:MAG: hypothetical protein M1835_006927 [Candelina submexicana]